MQVNGIDCPSCGAPITLKDGSSRSRCTYCGKEILIESKMIENIGEKVSTTFAKVEGQTQLEIKRLQVMQELSMLQMQLSNLKAEKRNLERDRSRKAQSQLKQIQEEENSLLIRITTLQRGLSHPFSSGSTEKNGFLTSTDISNCTYSTTLILAIFTGFLGGHRYYTGRIGSAIIQTFTLGGFYIWWIIDIISILSGNFKDAKDRPLNKGEKINPIILKTILCLVLGVFILGVIINATGSKGNESYAPFILFVSFALSAMLVNINKIFAYLIKIKRN